MRYLLLSALCLPFAVSAQGTADPFSALKVEQLATGFKFTEGPVWIHEGYWLFSDIPANRIYRLVPGGKAEVWREPSNQSNGLTLDREGRLIACEHETHRVTRTEADGTITVLAADFAGKALNSPNDIVVLRDGTIFVTDPTYGLGKRTAELPYKGVYMFKPGNKIAPVLRGLDMPNGIVFSPDEHKLYVADTAGNLVRHFDLAPDGTVVGGQVFARVPNPDGMRVDTKGNLYVASKDGIAVFAPNGDRLGTIPCPEVPANCAFGGTDGCALLITARKGVYAVQVPIPGIVP